MAYELATIAEPTPTNAPQQTVMREDKEIAIYSDATDRYAKALAKATGKASQPVIADSAAAVAEPAAPSGGSLPLSPQLAALARKEQKFRQEQQAFKAKAAALETERQEIADLKALKAKLAAGDYSEAEKFIDYEKFTQAKLGKDPKSEELEALRSDIAKLKADQEKDVEDRFKSAVNQRRVAVKELVAKSDEFKAIKAKKAEEAVVQHILDTWENEEVDLSPEEAAKEIETELRSRAKEWAALVGEEKKETQVEVAADKKELPPLKPAMKTLTNNMAATGEIKRPTKPLHLMTDTERYQEAYRRAQEKAQERYKGW